jgi:hypothetical protein
MTQRFNGKRIVRCLKEGNTVTYRVRILRGYLWGYRGIAFKPDEWLPLGDTVAQINIDHRLKCFRFDERPYDKPEWTVEKGENHAS